MGVKASSKELLQLEKNIQASIVEGHLIELRQKKEKHIEAIKEIEEEIKAYEERAKKIWDGNDEITDCKIVIDLRRKL